MSFEAPALEEFLIESLDPCDNDLGRPNRDERNKREQ
jgi:hypothetical protein